MGDTNAICFSTDDDDHSKVPVRSWELRNLPTARQKCVGDPERRDWHPSYIPAGRVSFSRASSGRLLAPFACIRRDREHTRAVATEVSDYIPGSWNNNDQTRVTGIEVYPNNDRKRDRRFVEDLSETVCRYSLVALSKRNEDTMKRTEKSTNDSALNLLAFNGYKVTSRGRDRVATLPTVEKF